MGFLSMRFILLMCFLSISISKIAANGKNTISTKSNCGCLTPGAIMKIQEKLEILSDTQTELQTEVSDLNFDERLKSLEKKIYDYQNEKLNDLETKLRELIGHNQKSIKENKNEIFEKEKKIQININQIKDVDNKLVNVSGRVQTNFQTLQESSNKIENVLNTANENSGKISNNSQKIEAKGKDIDSLSKKTNQNSVETSSVANIVQELIKNISSYSPGIPTNEFNILKGQIESQLNAHGHDIKTAVNKVENINQELQSFKNYAKENTKLINETQEGLKTAKEDLLETKKIANQIVAKINKPRSLTPFTEKIRMLKSLVYVWKISEISKKTVGKKWSIESDVFPLNGYPWGAKVKLSPSAFSSDELGISICFKDVLNAKPDLQVRPFPEVTYVIKDQSQNARKKDRVAPHSVHFNTSVAFDEFVFEEYLMFKKRLLSAGFVKDDSLLIEVHVEPPEMAHQAQSLDGNVIASVDQLSYRIELAKDYFVWWSSSPYFYTHPLGYRVQAQLWLHYNDKIVPQILFLTGDHDQTLAHSFPHKTTLTVYNLNDLSKNLTRSEIADFTDSSMYELPGFTYDEVKHFLENDTLYYKISIEPK